jgi:hypothetical protein
MITKDDAKKLSDTELKVCYNEYYKRYRKRNKDRWNAIRRDNYKRYHKIKNHSNNITKHLSL